MVEEAQPGMLRMTLLTVVVQVELRRLEEPVVLSGLAGGEARVEQAVLVLAAKLDAFGQIGRASCRERV